MSKNLKMKSIGKKIFWIMVLMLMFVILFAMSKRVFGVKPKPILPSLIVTAPHKVVTVKKGKTWSGDIGEWKVQASAEARPIFPYVASVSGGFSINGNMVETSKAYGRGSYKFTVSVTDQEGSCYGEALGVLTVNEEGGSGNTGGSEMINVDFIEEKEVDEWQIKIPMNFGDLECTECLTYSGKNNFYLIKIDENGKNVIKNGGSASGSYKITSGSEKYESIYQFKLYNNNGGSTGGTGETGKNNPGHEGSNNEGTWWCIQGGHSWSHLYNYEEDGEFYIDTHEHTDLSEGDEYWGTIAYILNEGKDHGHDNGDPRDPSDYQKALWWALGDKRHGESNSYYEAARAYGETTPLINRVPRIQVKIKQWKRINDLPGQKIWTTEFTETVPKANLDLAKIIKGTTTTLSGAEFHIKITGIKELPDGFGELYENVGFSDLTGDGVKFSLNNYGKLEGFTGLQFVEGTVDSTHNGYKDMTIEISETTSPTGYNGINGKIKISLMVVGNGKAAVESVSKPQNNVQVRAYTQEGIVTGDGLDVEPVGGPNEGDKFWGDVNSDGVVNTTDILIVMGKRGEINEKNCLRADVNLDGVFYDGKDAALVQNNAIGLIDLPCVEDLTVSVWVENELESPPPPPPQPEVNLDLTKIIKGTEERLPSATFHIYIENIAEIDAAANYERSDPVISDNIFEDYLVTDSNGRLVNLTGMRFVKDTSSNFSRESKYLPMTITIEEKKSDGSSGAPDGFVGMDGSIVIVLEVDDEGKICYGEGSFNSLPDGVTVGDGGSFPGVGTEVGNDTVSIKVANRRETINLSGGVWLDVTQIAKPSDSTDGVWNKNGNPPEKGIPGIRVYLYKSEGDNLIYVDKTETRSDNNIGVYEFNNLPKLDDNNKYYIYFSYDGIHYENTVEGDDQKATEAAIHGVGGDFNMIGKRPMEGGLPDSKTLRTDFNDRFKEIYAGKKIYKYYSLASEDIGIGDGIISEGNMEPPTTLEYDTYERKGYNTESILKTTFDFDIESHKNGFDLDTDNQYKVYKMYARTTNGYNTTTNNITFGLKERSLDLSLTQKVDTVSYNNNLCSIKESEQSSSANIDNVVYDCNIPRENDLGIYVSYRIRLHNEGYKTAYVKEIIDYFDARFKVDEISVSNEEIVPSFEVIKEEESFKIFEIGGKKYYKMIITMGENGISIPKGEKEVIVKLKVKGSDYTGEEEIETGEYNNLAEISKYSSVEGLIDKDSAPGNGAEMDESNIRYDEDDDFKVGANIQWEPLQLKLRKVNDAGDLITSAKPKFEITAHHENSDIQLNCETICSDPYDGTFDVTIKTISRNPVLVTIEEKTPPSCYEGIKPVTMKYTYTVNNLKWSGEIDGSDWNGPGEEGIYIHEHDEEEDKIKIMSNDPCTISVYNKLLAYKISGVVWEDENTDGNKDPGEPGVAGVEVSLLNGNGYVVNGVSSVMTDVSGAYLFGLLESGTYKLRFEYDGKTYKSTIYNNNLDNIPEYNVVENDFEDMKTASKAVDSAVKRLELMKDYAQNKTESQTMEAYTPLINITFEEQTVGNVDFGLMKRPQTKITLEEHITGLKISSGVGAPLIDTYHKDSEDVSLWADNKTYSLQGQQKSITPIATRKDNNGKWRIETDLELLHGSGMNVTYTYRVKNESEPEYFSDGLVEKFTDCFGNWDGESPIEDTNDYIKYLSGNTESTARAKLGESYFRGGEIGSIVPTWVGKVRSYTNDLNYKGEDDNKITGSSSYKFLDEDGNTKTGVQIKNIFESDNIGLVNIGSNEYGECSVVLNADGLSLSSVNAKPSQDGNTTLGNNKALTFVKYRSQIMDYINPIGPRTIDGHPGNMEERFIYSYDKNVVLAGLKDENGHISDDKYYIAEPDEYQTEEIIITMPTGNVKAEEIERAEWLQKLHILFTRSLTYPTPIDVRH